jgi:hypothetical protein
MSIRVYADTSVYGGVFDRAFADASGAFFALVRGGRFALLVSDGVRQEISRAPRRVRQHFDELLAYMSLVPFDHAVLRLRDAYVAAGIVGAQWADDAGHVAAATVGGAELIVSWNFKHIVHLDKIRLYNAVNALNGYRAIEIRSPAEVIEYEDE